MAWFIATSETSTFSKISILIARNITDVAQCLCSDFLSCFVVSLLQLTYRIPQVYIDIQHLLISAHVHNRPVKSDEKKIKLNANAACMHALHSTRCSIIYATPTTNPKPDPNHNSNPNPNLTPFSDLVFPDRVVKFIVTSN